MAAGGERGVSRWTAAALVVANMIGTGVFTSLGFQVAAVPSVFPLVLLWVVGGLFAMCGALCYAELAAALPRSGGEFHFLSRSIHPKVGFLAGWTSITVGFAAPVALAAMAFGKYFALAVPGVPPLAASVGSVLVVTGAHLCGLRSTALFQNAFTATKLLLILVLLAAGLAGGAAHPIPVLPAPGDWALVASGPFAVSLIYVMYAYSGWNASVYIAGEIRDPARSLPWSLVAGTLVVTVLYVAVNALFLAVAPLSELSGQLEVAGVVAVRVFGETGGRLMSGMIGLALVSCISAMTWAGPRIAQVMGEDHRPLRFLAARSRTGVPARAIGVQTVIVLVLLFSSTFERVMAYTQFTLNLWGLLTVGGLFLLRWREPSLPRPYRVWGYPVTPLLFILIALAMLVFVLRSNPIESIAGLASIALGLLFYRKPRGATSAVALALAAALLSVPISAGAQTEVRRAQPADAGGGVDSPDQIARFLAGVEPGGDGPAAHLARNPRWMQHAQEMTAAWERFDEGRLKEIRRWSSGELKGRVPPTVFYPFSGPDFTYAYSFFPHARRYVLCGLEPVGSLPALDSLRDPFAGLGPLRGAFDTLLRAGYFVTKNMSADLRTGEMRGTVPVFAVMMARAGCRIRSIEAGGSRAVIRFEAPGGGGERVLEYYQQDLSNDGLRRSGFPGFVRGLGPSVAFVKSASYLMHRDGFSQVRGLLLDTSSLIIQDDSGVPLRHFDRGRWTLRLFGSYAPPLDIFKEHHQPDLEALYASMGGVAEVKFGFGYRWNPKEVVLFVAVPKR
jgi:APA family basic amino acid/polyamine antiporter